MESRVVIPSIAALKDFAGKPLATSRWLTVTQERIDLFAEATGDRQWIHVDPERARRESPFKKTIAHGNLTLSMCSGLLAEALEVKGVNSQIHTGFDRARFSTPVPTGSRIRMSGEIKSVRSLPRGGARVTFHVQMEVEGEKKPACVAEVVCLYLP